MPLLMSNLRQARKRLGIYIQQANEQDEDYFERISQGETEIGYLFMFITAVIGLINLVIYLKTKNWSRLGAMLFPLTVSASTFFFWLSGHHSIESKVGKNIRLHREHPGSSQQIYNVNNDLMLRNGNKFSIYYILLTCLLATAYLWLWIAMNYEDSCHLGELDVNHTCGSSHDSLGFEKYFNVTAGHSIDFVNQMFNINTVTVINYQGTPEETYNYWLGGCTFERDTCKPSTDALKTAYLCCINKIFFGGQRLMAHISFCLIGLINTHFFVRYLKSNDDNDESFLPMSTYSAFCMLISYATTILPMTSILGSSDGVRHANFFADIYRNSNAIVSSHTALSLLYLLPFMLINKYRRNRTLECQSINAAINLIYIAGYTNAIGLSTCITLGTILAGLAKFMQFHYGSQVVKAANDKFAFNA